MAVNKELAKWKERLSVADRKFKPQLKKLDLYMKYYSSDQWHDKAVTGMYHDNPVDNMLYANTRVIVPRLNFRNPKIFVTPRKKPYKSKDGIVNTTSTAVAMEILLNYYYRHLKTKRETRRCLFDALIGGYGVMEVGYTLETEKVAQKGKNKGDLLIVDELIKSESPYMVRRSPKDLRWDTEARDTELSDARWISLDWVRPLEDVKADPRFKNTSKLKSNFTVKVDAHGMDKGSSDTSNNLSDNPDLWKRVKGRDIWDKKTQKVFTLVEGHDKFLREDKWPLIYDGAFPIEILFFNELPDESIPIADFDIYKRAQDELNQLKAINLSHLRRISQRKIFAQKENMNDDAMRAYTHGPDGTVVEVASIDQVKTATDPTISQDMYIGVNNLKSDIHAMSGVSPTEALATNNFDQATEPALLEKASTTIREDQRDVFEGFLIRNIKKLGQVLQQVMPETDIPLNEPQFADSLEFLDSKLYKIVGTDTTAIFPWLTLNQEDINGDYDYDIEVGSTQAVNEETRKADIVQVSEMLTGSPLIKEREATIRVLEAFNVKDIDRLLKSDEEVQEEGQAQDEAQKAAELEPLQMKHQTDLAKTDKKSQTALATAQIKADTEVFKAKTKADTEEGKSKANFLAGALRDTSRRGQRE